MAVELTSHHCLIHSDNSCSVSAIRKKGSSDPFRDYITREIFKIAKNHNFTIDCTWVAGKSNFLADRLSRRISHSATTEWAIHDSTWELIKQWTPFTFTIDLMSSYLNNRVPVYCSRTRDPHATFVDAYKIDWSQYKCLCFLSLQPNKQRHSESSSGQGKRHRPAYPSPPRGLMVSNVNEKFKVPTVVAPGKHGKTLTPTLGQRTKTSIVKQNENDFKHFMYRLLRSNKISSKQARHIADFGWRSSTVAGYTTATKRWLKYCEETSKDCTLFSLENVLGFLEYLAISLEAPFNPCRNAKSFATICRKFTGEEFSAQDTLIIKKYLAGLFNQRPPCVKDNITWDVNILLRHLINLGENDKLTAQVLGGKLMLLILLSTMCRSQEAMQINLQLMARFHDGVTFNLPTPTKTYTPNNVQPGLQKLTLLKLDSVPLLCPVKTLDDYLVKTKEGRFFSDIFVLMGPKFGPASRQTVVRWAKDHLIAAGLGDYTLHSCRSSASTKALLTCLPLNLLCQKVGWSTATTFVRTYMRPLLKSISEKANKNGDRFNSTVETVQQNETTQELVQFRDLWTSAKPRTKPDKLALIQNKAEMFSANKGKRQPTHTVSKPPKAITPPKIQKTSTPILQNEITELPKFINTISGSEFSPVKKLPPYEGKLWCPPPPACTPQVSTACRPQITDLQSSLPEEIPQETLKEITNDVLSSSLSISALKHDLCEPLIDVTVDTVNPTKPQLISILKPVQVTKNIKAFPAKILPTTSLSNPKIQKRPAPIVSNVQKPKNSVQLVLNDSSNTVAKLLKQKRDLESNNFDVKVTTNHWDSLLQSNIKRLNTESSSLDTTMNTTVPKLFNSPVKRVQPGPVKSMQKDHVNLAPPSNLTNFNDGKGQGNDPLKGFGYASKVRHHGVNFKNLIFHNLSPVSETVLPSHPRVAENKTLTDSIYKFVNYTHVSEDSTTNYQ